MSSQTKIVVLHMKEIIYTLLFILLGALFIFLLVCMFRPKEDAATSASNVITGEAAVYVPGVYTTNLILKDQSVDVEVIVDENHINSVKLVHLDEAVATMYPLLAPTMDTLEQQILEAQSLDGVTYTDDCRYTAMVLLDAIAATLEKATPGVSENEVILP